MRSALPMIGIEATTVAVLTPRNEISYPVLGPELKASLIFFYTRNSLTAKGKLFTICSPVGNQLNRVPLSSCAAKPSKYAATDVRAILIILWIAAAAASIGNAGSESTNTTAATTLQTTNQPRTLAELLSLSPTDLEKLDLARMNLLCAEGLRGSENLDVEDLLRTLDGWTHDVESETKRNFHHFAEEPKQFNNSLPYYQMGMMGTVLAEDLRIQYNPERERELLKKPINKQSVEEQSAFFSSSADVFLHGLLSGKHYGTCASMPFLYAAIGRRLGYPVTIAARKYHLYVRYEAGNGEHLNMEATENRGFSTPTDAEYRTGEYPMRQAEIDGCGWLRPLSNKEILGICLLNRANCLRSMKQYDEEVKALSQAARYLPETPLMRRVVSKNQELARNLHAADSWDELWNELENLRLPTAGSKFEHFRNGKTAVQLFMNQSTNLAEIEKSVSAFKEDLKQYQKEISDSSTKLAEAYGAQQTPDQRRLTSLLGDVPFPEAPLGHIAIPRATVPAEYRNGTMPDELQRRLEKLMNARDVVEEMNAFYAEEIQLRNLDVQQSSQYAGEEASLPAGWHPREHAHFSDFGIDAQKIPWNYRNVDVPPELQKHIVGRTWQLSAGSQEAALDEIRRYNVDQIQKRLAREAIQKRRYALDQMPQGHPPTHVEIVDLSPEALDLTGPLQNPAPKSETSQLTPEPESLKTGSTDGKGKP